MISKVQVLRNRLKAICVEQWIIVAEILFLFTICFLHSVSAGHYVDFYPMNGTFQNYNPVRRYLAGQVPYRDFQDYLGFGHQIMGSITTVLFGGDYQRSLMAFSFLTILSFAMLSVVIGLAIFQKKTVVLGITNIMLVFMLTNSFFFINWGGGVLEEVKGALVASLEVGNSARFVRGMIIPVVCILLLLCHHLFIQMIKRKSAWVQYGVYIKIIGVGLIAGLAFIWSNDYGISCWVCLLVMTFIVVFSRTRKIKYALLYTIFEMFISTLWIFIFVEIITLGHFRNWFLGTFGTGGYQNWYYNSLGMSFFLFDVDFSFLMLIEGFLCVIYLIKLFVCHADTRSLVRYGVPAFIIMTGFCAGNEYKLLSGGELRQMALSALFLIVLYEILVFVCSYGKKKKICEMIIISSAIVSLAWIISDFKQEVLFWKVDEKIGHYISQLGGRITSLGQDLIDTSRFLDGNSFFSTYASAQEVVENTFQPSGTDYIIHALGDSQREKYLNSFKNGDFTYTATIKETYELYEYWCQRANWFFYRELYANWHPVYANTYEKYWARNAKEETHILSGKYNIEVENIDESTKKLILKTDRSVNGVADVYIDYAVKKKDNRIAKLLFHSVLKVQNTGTQYAEDEYYEYNYLRNAGSEYIPVTIVDGYGEVTLTSLPDTETYLELYKSSCDTIYNVIYDYVEATFVEDNGAEILVITANNKFNENILKDIAGIMIGRDIYQVSEVRKNDDQLYLVIPDVKDTINIDDSILDNGNMFQIVR